jgi:hypothetical protein
VIKRKIKIKSKPKNPLAGIIRSHSEPGSGRIWKPDAWYHTNLYYYDNSMRTAWGGAEIERKKASVLGSAWSAGLGGSTTSL